MSPEPRLLGRALGRLEWKGRRDWEVAGVLGNALQSARAVGRRAREAGVRVRVDAERAARSVGAMARCVVVSGMVERQPHICLWLRSGVEEGFRGCGVSELVEEFEVKPSNLETNSAVSSQQGRRQRCLASAGPTVDLLQGS